MNKFKINTKLDFENFVASNWVLINRYLDSKIKDVGAPLYTSIDIRESRDKFAPVDNNLYPAGFNNICQKDLNYSGTYFNSYIKNILCNKTLEENTHIGIYPESHTRNTFYLDHLVQLKRILEIEGYKVSIVSNDPNLFSESSFEDCIELVSQSKFDITIKRLKIKDNSLYAIDEKIDFIILNNDQSVALNIDWNSFNTPVHPTPHLGWFNREKSNHFRFYQDVIEEFSNEFSVNPDILQAKFTNHGDIDFLVKEDLHKLHIEATKLFEQLPENSKVFLKAGQGTYGMGITVISHPDEVLEMNRKMRNKMNKGKIKFQSVILQEGIESIIKYDDMPAEVTIYLVGGSAIGGFIRANSTKNSISNLNSKGAIFKKYCISEIKENSDYQLKEAVYAIVARLSTLATSLEINNLNKE